MSLFDTPLSVFEISRKTKLPMSRIQFLINRYGIESDGRGDHGKPLFWWASIKEVSEQHERVVAAARADWVRRHPPVRY
jgi:hypothetical protein